MSDIENFGEGHPSVAIRQSNLNVINLRVYNEFFY